MLLNTADVVVIGVVVAVVAYVAFAVVCFNHSHFFSFQVRKRLLETNKKIG